MSDQQLSSTNTVQATCPRCRQVETVVITEEDLFEAKKQHRLVAKAIPHESHIFALYIDPALKVRRRYCFDTAGPPSSPFSSRKTIPTSDLEEIFSRMFEDAKKG